MLLLDRRFRRNFGVTRAAIAMAAATALAWACGGATLQGNAAPDGGSPDSAAVDVVVADAVGAPDVIGAPDAVGADAAADDAPDVADEGACNPGVVPTLPVPVFTPPSGDVVDVGQSWSITCPDAPPGSVIYYTTGSTVPTRQSKVFAGPLQFMLPGTVTINAICAPPPGCLGESPLGTATYKVAPMPVCGCPVAPAVVSPVAGTMNNDFICSMMSGTPTATICYTTDGTIPTCDAPTGACTGVSKTYDAASGVRIDGTLTDSMGGVVVQTVACAPGITPSPVISVAYVLEVADPTMANPGPGTYSLPGDGGGLTPTISTITMDGPGSPVSISLAAYGGSPSCAGAQFPSPTTFAGQAGEPSPLTSTTTVSAVACKPGYRPSNVASFAYTIQ
jgi:hypothetical protein